MDISKIVLDVRETIGEKTLLLEWRPSFSYAGGVKGEQDGIKLTCLSEKAGYEKIDIKIPGMMSLPFEFNNTPIPVVFEEISGKLWQDWSNKGTVKMSVVAKGIKPVEVRRKVQLNG